MAEAIARQLIRQRQLDGFEVQSAGTFASANSPASDGSLLVALENGLDLTPHRSQELSVRLVEWADVILAMGQHHRDAAEAQGGSGKTHMLTSYASNGSDDRAVSDPFGGSLDVYRSTFVELTQEIGAILDRAQRVRDRHSA